MQKRRRERKQRLFKESMVYFVEKQTFGEGLISEAKRWGQDPIKT